MLGLIAKSPEKSGLRGVMGDLEKDSEMGLQVPEHLCLRLSVQMQQRFHSFVYVFEISHRHPVCFGTLPALCVPPW